MEVVVEVVVNVVEVEIVVEVEDDVVEVVVNVVKVVVVTDVVVDVVEVVVVTDVVVDVVEDVGDDTGVVLEVVVDDEVVTDIESKYDNDNKDDNVVVKDDENDVDRGLNIETKIWFESTAGILESFLFDIIAFWIQFRKMKPDSIESKTTVESTITLPYLKLWIITDFKFVIPCLMKDSFTFLNKMIKIFKLNSLKKITYKRFIVIN